MKIEGGCLCGQVRYRSEGDGLFTALCHCTHCQKQSGSAFSIIVGVKARTLEITGQLGEFQDKSQGGRGVTRQFCPNCGSALFSVGDGAPGITFLKAGTLDDTSGLQPQMELWTASAQPWVKFEKPLKQFAGQPEG